MKKCMFTLHHYITALTYQKILCSLKLPFHWVNIVAGRYSAKVHGRLLYTQDPSIHKSKRVQGSVAQLPLAEYNRFFFTHQYGVKGNPFRYPLFLKNNLLM